LRKRAALIAEALQPVERSAERNRPCQRFEQRLDRDRSVIGDDFEGQRRNAVAEIRQFERFEDAVGEAAERRAVRLGRGDQRVERLVAVAGVDPKCAASSSAAWVLGGVRLIILYYLFVAAFGALLYATVGFNFSSIAATGTLPLSWLLATVVSSTLVSMVWSTVQSSLYLELRNWKEGLPEQSLEEIFA